MTINQVKVLWFGIGAVIGGLAGFFGTKMYVENELEKGLEGSDDGVYDIRGQEYGTTDDLAYQKHIKRYTDYARNHPEKDPIEVVSDIRNTEGMDHPYIIDADCFASDGLENNKLTITYYEGDDTLVDDGEEIIVDRDMIIGMDTLRQFGDGGSMDPDVVYVRNEQLGIDYEIIRRYDCYHQEVPPVIPLSKPRKKGRKDV